METQNSSTSSFKSFLLKILFPFIACAVILGTGFQWIFEKKVILNSETTGSYKVNRVINAIDQSEIPVFGSSRAEGGYVPGILGKNYFNYGISGTGDDVLVFFLREECRKKKKTPILVNFDMDGFAPVLGDISNYIYNSEYPAVKKLLGPKYKPLFRVPFVKYYGYYEFYFKMYLNNRVNLTKKTDKGASLELNTITKKKFDEQVALRLASSFEFRNDPAIEKDFLDIVSSHKDREFFIVLAPYHKSCFVHFKNPGKVARFLDVLAAFPNVKVLDFSHRDYPDSLFMNTSHLNYRGALRFSKELKDSLGTLRR